MADISSINNRTVSTTSKASSNNGLSGLVSGIDTEKMVDSMLAATQAKIDRANQTKQQLLWKQDIVRDVITKLQSFQTKFFSFTSDTSNLLSSAFYNTMSTVSSSASVRAVASSQASTGTMVINSVTQLATRHKRTAKETALGPLQGTLDMDKLSSLMQERTLKLQVGAEERTITIKGNTEQAILDNLNAELEAAFGEGEVTATVTDGVLSIKSKNEEDTITISSDSSKTALSILGLKDGATTGEATGKIDATQAETTLSVTLDGIQKNITLNTEAASLEEFTSDLQESLRKAFGSSIQVSESDGVLTFTPMKVIYSTDEFGNLVESGLTADPSRQIIMGGSTAVMDIFGMQNGQSNKLALGMTLDSIPFSRALEEGAETFTFTINGEDFTFSAKDSISTVINTVNQSKAGVILSYSSLEDKFSITSANYGAGNEITMSDTGGGLLHALFGAEQQEEIGRNAVLTVGGVELQRSSNNFTIDGVTLTLVETTNTPVTIDVTRDTEKVSKGLADFVEEYNKLIDELNQLINAKSTYKSYAPLTAAQKAEMSTKEIELWEEKAKEGLLRGDSTISRLLTDMRSALYSKVAGSSYALYNIGIDTSSDYKDYGKLVIKDSAELQKALEADPASLQKLFNDPENGIATKLNQLINQAAKVSYASPGSLVSMAGTAAIADEKSTLGRQIKEQEKQLERLKTLYEAEKTRYWKQFNAMEQLISQMNQQSTWLASQFA